MAQTKLRPVDILQQHINYDEWFAVAPVVEPWARKFYREYAGISDEEELKKHLMEVREAAWKIYKYRCVASFFFVNYNLGGAFGEKWYSTIIERLKDGELLLDLACAFGHAARNLVYDGAPVENVISGDLRQEFWDLGYQLYCDKDRFHGVFFQGDFFDSSYLQEYNGKFDMIHNSAFFHLFDLPDQHKIVKRLVQLLRDKPGSVLFGRAAGNTKPCLRQHPSRPGQVFYQHNEESFKEMWDKAAGDGWNVKTGFHTRPENIQNGGLAGRLVFIITKL
jgi:SAM-dependent methyltransferase